MNVKLRNGTQQLAALVGVVSSHVDAIRDDNTIALFELVVHCKTGKAIDESYVDYLRKRRLLYPHINKPAPSTANIIDAMFDLVVENGRVIDITQVDPQ